MYLDEDERLPIVTELWNHLEALQKKMTINRFKKINPIINKHKLSYADSSSYLWRDINDSSYIGDEDLQEIYTDILKIE